MRLSPLHRWDLSPAEARSEQGRLSGKVKGGSLPERGTVLGVDVSYGRWDKTARAAAVLLTWPGMEVLGEWRVETPVAFPYVPGLLSFREVPALLPLLAGIPRPSLILADGQGIAHPRRFGLACHIGLLTALPTIGCAKSRLCGEHPAVPEQAGGAVPLTLAGEKVGFALRSRAGCRPLFISPGHLLTPGEALRGVRLALRGRRLPEPTRLADALTRGQA